ncbi:hypothetical protein N5K55_04065 (plasmid) [Pseudomonas aeruginosa]|nr:hypothetical protein [Pseudomonas aeruginosa]
MIFSHLGHENPVDRLPAESGIAGLLRDDIVKDIVLLQRGDGDHVLNSMLVA